MKQKTIQGGAGLYASPELRIINLRTEGVLCSSVPVDFGSGNEGYEEDPWE